MITGRNISNPGSNPGSGINNHGANGESSAISAPYFDTSRDGTPKLAAIAEAWCDCSELAETFPNLRALAIGWDEPFCFRCGWLTPIRIPGPRAVATAWNRSSGWLERAHLQDVRCGGNHDPLNLVPLCPICHEQQPVSETRAHGIGFVNSPSPHAEIIWMVQVVTDAIYINQARPGRSALRKLLRAYGESGVAMGKMLQQIKSITDHTEEGQ